jgi:hypothetical protein
MRFALAFCCLTSFFIGLATSATAQSPYTSLEKVRDALELESDDTYFSFTTPEGIVRKSLVLHTYGTDDMWRFSLTLVILTESLELTGIVLLDDTPCPQNAPCPFRLVSPDLDPNMSIYLDRKGQWAEISFEREISELERRFVTDTWKGGKTSERLTRDRNFNFDYYFLLRGE